MTGTQEILNRVYQVAKGLKPFVNGDAYKEERPPKSNKEDIVVNVLASEPSSAQQTIVNVNIYVKDKQVKVNEISYFAPNSERLAEVETKAIEYLKENYEGDFFFYCISCNTLKEQITNEHFLNFRLLVTTVKP